MRYYSFTFRVGGIKSGFDCTVEVKAKNKRGANLRIRNRIRKMPDVAEMPEFTLADIKAGRTVMASEGHDRNGYNKRTRPVDLKQHAQQQAKNDADAIAAYLRRIGADKDYA